MHIHAVLSHVQSASPGMHIHAVLSHVQSASPGMHIHAWQHCMRRHMQPYAATQQKARMTALQNVAMHKRSSTYGHARAAMHTIMRTTMHALPCMHHHALAYM
eukprot:361176-Chlamydomonas_euryale.AAC.2